MRDTLHEYRIRPGLAGDGAPLVTFGHETCTWHVEGTELTLEQQISLASEHRLNGCRIERKR